jgi:hypothetical protein
MSKTVTLVPENRFRFRYAFQGSTAIERLKDDGYCFQRALGRHLVPTVGLSRLAAGNHGALKLLSKYEVALANDHGMAENGRG